jgi:23S rRNA (adenine2503-C2)-methyltransferase
MTLPFFFDFNLSELVKHPVFADQPDYRAMQVWQQVYTKLKFDPMQINNVPLELRRKMKDAFDFEPVTVAQKVSGEGNQAEKIAFNLRDGAKIETVLMRYTERNTICISTQVGCGMGCVFCATGQMGFTRNLETAEIVGQVMYFAKILREEGSALTNIVIMGMGEPFVNYDAVLKSIDILNDPDGFQFGERRITISTVGIVPMIEKFTQAKRQINLAVSLHAPTNAIRDKILPINKTYPIEKLLIACNGYAKYTKRRISFEYALIDGVNDSLEDASQLAHLLKGMLCHVNLIPLNPTRNYGGKGTKSDHVKAFYSTLTRAGIPCSIRVSRGVEIGAGCGQLVNKA